MEARNTARDVGLCRARYATLWEPTAPAATSLLHLIWKLLQPGSLTQGKSLIDAYRKNRDVGLLQVLFWNSGTIKDRGCRRLPALSGYLPAGLRAGDCLHAGKHEAAHAHDSRTRPPLWTATGEKIQIRSGSFLVAPAHVPRHQRNSSVSF